MGSFWSSYQAEMPSVVPGDLSDELCIPAAMPRRCTAE